METNVNTPDIGRPFCQDCGKELTEYEYHEFGYCCQKCHDFWENK